MFLESDMDTIEQYVDGRYFDRDKLVKYLSIHEIVGNEVFSYCSNDEEDNPRYTSWIDSDAGYAPIPVATFVRRIPFYFYINEKRSRNVGNLGNIIVNVQRGPEPFDLEKMYVTLEFMF